MVPSKLVTYQIFYLRILNRREGPQAEGDGGAPLWFFRFQGLDIAWSLQFPQIMLFGFNQSTLIFEEQVALKDSFKEIEDWDKSDNARIKSATLTSKSSLPATLRSESGDGLGRSDKK